MYASGVGPGVINANTPQLVCVCVCVCVCAGRVNGRASGNE